MHMAEARENMEELINEVKSSASALDRGGKWHHSRYEHSSIHCSQVRQFRLMTRYVRNARCVCGTVGSCILPCEYSPLIESSRLHRIIRARNHPMCNDPHRSQFVISSRSSFAVFAPTHLRELDRVTKILERTRSSKSDASMTAYCLITHVWMRDDHQSIQAGFAGPYGQGTCAHPESATLKIEII